MTQKDQEWMEQYIDQVVRRLPKNQREEVGMELQELIGDMLEQSDSMETVLAELGDPAAFAQKYRDDSHCLIGPEYFDTYLWFMRIVLLCTLLVTFAVSLIEEIVQVDNAGIVGMMVSCSVNVLIKCFDCCISVFSWVTILFAIMERQKVKFEKKSQKKRNPGSLGKKIWTPKELDNIPHKKAIISGGDSIVGIVCIVIFCTILIVEPNFFSIYFRDSKASGNWVVVPFLNLEQWDIILPMVVISLFIGLAEEVLKLIMGVYCRLVMFGSAISGVLQIILAIVILKILPFWNPNLVQQATSQWEAHMSSEFRQGWLLGWDAALASNGIICFMIVFTLIEIGFTVYNTLRYGTK